MGWQPLSVARRALPSLTRPVLAQELAAHAGAGACVSRHTPAGEAATDVRGAGGVRATETGVLQVGAPLISSVIHSTPPGVLSSPPSRGDDLLSLAETATVRVPASSPLSFMQIHPTRLPSPSLSPSQQALVVGNLRPPPPLHVECLSPCRSRRLWRTKRGDH